MINVPGIDRAGVSLDVYPTIPTFSEPMFKIFEGK